MKAQDYNFDTNDRDRDTTEEAIWPLKMKNSSDLKATLVLSSDQTKIRHIG